MIPLKILCKYKQIGQINRKLSSALYITGEKATNTFAVVTPHLDLEERLQNRTDLELNLKYRGHITQVHHLEQTYELLKQIEHEMTIAEVTRSEISKRLSALLKNPEANEDDINKLKTPASICKKEYKEMRDQFLGIEEVTALKILNLPNVLHKKTPLTNLEIVYEHLSKPIIVGNVDSHLDLATKNELIEYVDPTFVVLKNDAALFELSILNYFQSKLLQNSFTQFSNCDFARSVVLEGCGVDFKSKFNTFTLDYKHHEVKNELVRDHLVGGASLYAFMAFFTKHFVQLGYLPLKLFASGRQYNPVEKNTHSLFNTTQSSAIQTFVATKDDEELENIEVDSLQNFLIDLYKDFGVHFRVCRLPCNKIENSESLKLSLQMFSLHLNDYVAVANISVYEKYLSKRLLFTYSEQKEQRFLRVVSGTVLNVQKLLGCLLENNSASGKELIPSLFKQYVQ